MYKRFLEKPLKGDHSFFLFGPRGTGKTSWLKSRIPNSLYIDLLDQEVFFELLKNPHKVEEMIPKGFKEWIIIDEIQKIPPLLNEVHRMIENYRYKFILTGSSARTLRRRGTNLLAGRALYYKMFPLTALELGKDFSLEKSLRFGQLPIVHAQSVNPRDYLKSYTHVYLREEVMQEGLVRNIGSFAKFLQVASFSQGSTLNMTQIAKDISIERKTVEEYFQIVEDLLLASRIPVFTKRTKRKTITHPKFYYFDVGVYRALRPMGPFDAPEEAEGPALETLMLQEIQAMNHYFELDYEIYFWRTTDKLEVDFILYGPKGLIGIEIKRSKKIHSNDLKALKAFQEDYPSAKLYLFYGGSKRLYFDKIEAIPFQEALQTLPTLLGA
ncbi:ATP-binding protein [Candidatus Neptunochlamydia vexilliferae]|uniref:ATP-binding protein n=1 Tax=Candidatus Neptunichlamydia vexilliferae TaxID=1651774 RepID=UPI001890FB16|nr:AAA family ATPase [Candidatus Neptunochlamydia vexilliferae]